jgi:hypothetical protein
MAGVSSSRGNAASNDAAIAAAVAAGRPRPFAATGRVAKLRNSIQVLGGHVQDLAPPVQFRHGRLGRGVGGVGAVRQTAQDAGIDQNAHERTALLV